MILELVWFVQIPSVKFGFPPSLYGMFNLLFYSISFQTGFLKCRDYTNNSLIVFDLEFVYKYTPMSLMSYHSIT